MKKDNPDNYFGHGRWYSRLLHARRKIHNEDVQNQAEEAEHATHAILEDGSKKPGEDLRDRILQATEETKQEHLRAKAEEVGARGGTWILARPLWQIAALGAGVAIAAHKIRKKGSK